MTIKRILFVITLILISSGLFSQNISGIITDGEGGNRVAYANVFLLSSKDSIPLNMAASDTTGYFSFSNAKVNDSLILNVHHLGYITYRQIIKSDEQFPLMIRLKPSSTELSAVTVTSATPLFKMKGTTLNVQVENSVLSEVGKLPQMLQYIPFVNSSNNGIQIFGKGQPLFYINSRQERDINKINQIDAKEIKNIEVILSPDTEYDASVGAVIKIYLKSKQGDGLSGSFDTLLAWGDYLSETGRLNLNYRKEKTDIFGKIRFQDIRTKMNKESDTEIADKVAEIYQFISQANTKNITFGLDGSVGINTDIDANRSIGARFDFTHSPKYQQIIERKEKQYLNTISYSDYQMNNQYKGLYHVYSGNAYYDGLWWKKLTASCNIDFEKRNDNRKFEFNQTDLSYGNPPIQSKIVYHYNLYSGKINLQYPVCKGKITLGNELVFTDYFQQYESNYTASYADGMKNLSQQRLYVSFLNMQYPIKKLVIQGGMRYELVKYDYFIGEKKETEIAQNRENFFPSLSLAFTDKNMNLNLTYRNGISRPEYYLLRATTEYNSPYEYLSGNPNLQPTLKHEIGASFAYKKLYLISGYTYQKNLIVLLSEQYKNDPAIVRTAYNLPKYETLFVQASWSTIVNKWNCFADFGINFPLSKLEIYDKKYDFRKPKCYLSVNNIFSLPHKFNLYFNAAFYSDGYEGVYSYKPNSNIQVGLTKEVFVKNLTASIWLVDIFKTNTDNYTYNISNVSRKINSYNGERMLMFTLNYLFNNTESRYQNSRSGIEERQRL
jgi:hypothetical protein